MFFPIRDDNPTVRTPYLTIALIVLNCAVFLYTKSLGFRGFEVFTFYYGFTPDIFFNLDQKYVVPNWVYLTPLTSMFMHGGWMHLIGNMLYLYIFGDNVEDRLGHFGYLVFYFMVGIGAGLTEVFFEQHSAIPIIGASGAIAGVLGAYFLLFPRAKILTLIPLFVFFPVIEISAFFFLGFWFVMQFINGSLSAGTEAGGGVAWWAHAGGFVVGAALMPVFLLLRKISSR